MVYTWGGVEVEWGGMGIGPILEHLWSQWMRSWEKRYLFLKSFSKVIFSPFNIGS